jgi:hypothetical protein
MCGERVGNAGRMSVRRGLAWVALAILVAGLHAIIVIRLPRENEQTYRRLREVRDGKLDVLLLGDSVTLTTASSDADTRSLGDMTQANLAPCTSRVMADAAYHMELFEAVGAFMSKAGRTAPKVIVVPINLRLFTTSAVAHPGWRRSELVALLKHDSFAYELVTRPLGIFKWYDRLEGSVEDYFRTPVYDGSRIVGRIADLGFVGKDLLYAEPPTPSQLRAAVLMQYMQEIRPDDERVKAMVTLAQTLRAAGIKPLFYVVPIDWMSLEAIMGTRVTERLRLNVSTLVRALDQEGIRTRDWSMLLEDAVFTYRHYPNEHLKQRGRQVLADRLSAAACEELGSAGCCRGR